MQDTTTAAAAPDAPYPSRLYAWYVVVLLTIAYAISLLDRWILSLLVGPVKAHFGVSDTQMGLLMGFWFAVFYVTMGLPFGWLADRRDRRRIIALAMAFWCTMTVFCGLARNFAQLVVARLGIGLGEAALTPAANSMIADLFPRAQQNRAITFFNMGISMGMGIAYLIGGAIVAWMALRPAVSLPLVGRLETWQVVFIAAGLPGLFIALLIACLREPLRRERLNAADQPAIRDCIAYLRTNAGAYRPLFIGMAASPLIGYAWNWLPTLFDRAWGWNIAQFTGIYGWILLVFGPAGALTGGWLATRWYRAGRKDAPYTAALLGLVVMTLVAALLPLAPSAEVAMWLLIPGTWAGAMNAAAGAASAVFMTPGEYRAQVTSLYVLTINGIGLLVGPSVVGWLNDQVFTTPDGVRYSLVAVAAVGAAALTLYFATGRRAYAESVARLEAAQLQQGMTA